MPWTPRGAADGATTRGWIVPAIIGSGLMMQTLNATVIVNALPSMARAMDEPPLRLNLAITMYLLAAAVFLPVSGWVADKFGAKRIFMLAMVLYALSSAACGFAQTLPQLIAARILQGAAGAMVAPVGRLVLLRTTPKSELVGAMSVLTMPALLGPVLGPLIGGAIVTFADWRWIFFMNLPVAVAGIALVRAFVPNVKAQDVHPIDVTGILLTGVGLAALIFGFENLGRSFLPAGLVIGLFVLGAVSLGLYGLHAKRNPHAIIDLSIFRLPTFQAATVGGAFMRIAMGANPFLLAMLLQVGFGLSAFAAGTMTFISAVGGARHEDHRAADPAPVRVQAGAGGQCGDRRRQLRRLRPLPALDAALDHHDRARGRRLLPLSAVHQPERPGLCRGRPGPDEPGLDHRGHGSAARAVGGHRAGRRPAALPDARPRRKRAHLAVGVAGLPDRRRDHADLDAVVRPPARRRRRGHERAPRLVTRRGLAGEEVDPETLALAALAILDEELNLAFRVRRGMDVLHIVQGGVLEADALHGPAAAGALAGPVDGEAALELGGLDGIGHGGLLRHQRREGRKDSLRRSDPAALGGGRRRPHAVLGLLGEPAPERGELQVGPPDVRDRTRRRQAALGVGQLTVAGGPLRPGEL
ncbi:MFS transporter [Phenylobacterium sp. J367]|nr:MFS transporter [Phenylobacterium sp. J367]MCR5879332.1 MFS transporter [Phenylobacterium sp. J367]